MRFQSKVRRVWCGGVAVIRQLERLGDNAEGQAVKLNQVEGRFF
jgi:hypothetical protein